MGCYYDLTKIHDTWKEEFDVYIKTYFITIEKNLKAKLEKQHADGFYKKYVNMFCWFEAVGIVWFGFTHCEISNENMLTCWRDSEPGIMYYVFFHSRREGWLPFVMETNTCNVRYINP